MLLLIRYPLSLPTSLTNTDDSYEKLIFVEWLQDNWRVKKLPPTDILYLFFWNGARYFLFLLQSLLVFLEQWFSTFLDCNPPTSGPPEYPTATLEHYTIHFTLHHIKGIYAFAKMLYLAYCQISFAALISCQKSSSLHTVENSSLCMM